MAYCYSNYLRGDSSLQVEFLQNTHTSAEAKKVHSKLILHDLIPGNFKVNGYEKPTNDTFGNQQVFDKIKSQICCPDCSPLLREDLKGSHQLT